MSYDVKIVGGVVVDGNGGPPRRADVGVRHGLIVAVGDAPEDANEVIDADGTADFMGFGDRGRVAVGLRADLNVIDHGGLRLHRPRLVRDLPAGGKRLLQDVDGYRATLVAGTVVNRDGKLTGATPGRLVRGGQT
ncbi:MAG: hypothetical protein JRH11_17925 [Deltaproteobacteria bacterium]|nr:hypothetical protein [Deltaproteobacteria bacterium]